MFDKKKRCCSSLNAAKASMCCDLFLLVFQSFAWYKNLPLGFIFITVWVDSFRRSRREANNQMMTMNSLWLHALPFDRLQCNETMGILNTYSFECQPNSLVRYMKRFEEQSVNFHSNSSWKFNDLFKLNRWPKKSACENSNCYLLPYSIVKFWCQPYNFRVDQCH